MPSTLPPSTLPSVGDDIIVSMHAPARKYTCRMVVSDVVPFGPLVLVSGKELKLTGERTGRSKNQLRLDLATWKKA